MKEIGLYTDPNRKRNNASQSEIPKIIKKDNNLIITGYQNFCIDNKKNLFPLDERLKLKSLKIGALIKNLLQIGTTLNDIGCNSGFFSLLAHNIGYKKINSVDHDEEYINILKRILQEHRFNIIPFHRKSSDFLEKADITIALSLIHWIYSCTDSIGSIDIILNHFSKITKKILIIEWIDPVDVGIMSLGHIYFNSHIHKDKYELQTFLDAASNYFSKIELVSISNTKTRKIFLLWK